MPFLNDHPAVAAGFVGSTAVAGIAGMREFGRDAREPLNDRFDKSGMRALRAGMGTAGLTALGYGLYKSRAGIRTGAVASFFRKQYSSTMEQSAREKYALSALVPRGEEHAAHLASLGIEPMSRARVAIESYGRNGRLMAGGGAAAGLLVGAAYGHPVLGAAVGAGVGMAGKFGLGAVSTWNRAGKVPGLRGAGVLAISSLIFAGVEAMAPGAYEGEAAAVRDESGSYGYGPSVKSRMDSMGATGDLVLGLNRGRHG